MNRIYRRRRWMIGWTLSASNSERKRRRNITCSSTSYVKLNIRKRLLRKIVIKHQRRSLSMNYSNIRDRSLVTAVVNFKSLCLLVPGVSWLSFISDTKDAMIFKVKQQTVIFSLWFSRGNFPSFPAFPRERLSSTLKGILFSLYGCF